jgi:hypothetical protein
MTVLNAVDAETAAVNLHRELRALGMSRNPTFTTGPGSPRRQGSGERRPARASGDCQPQRIDHGG